nr:MAG TPA: hypothetical protein [Caudoviricetes sp.]
MNNASESLDGEGNLRLRTLQLCYHIIGAHNVYYVKLQAKTSKPLVMRVNLRKPLFSVP